MLVFSLQRGESFYVGDLKVLLVDFDAERAVLRVKGKEFDCLNHLVDLPRAEHCQVSAGQRGDRSIRIAIQAPLEIKVLRERLYLKDHLEKTQMRRKPKRARRVFADAIDCALCQGTMLVRQTDEDDRVVTLPCPRMQNRVLPVCSPKR